MPQENSRESSDKQSHPSLPLNWKVVSGLVLFVAWAMFGAYQMAASGIRHDYVFYVQQWAHILVGGDPWLVDPIPMNAYGPLHTLLAYAAVPGFLVPKFLFGLSFAALILVFVLHLLQRSNSRIYLDWLLFFVILPLNYLSIGVIFILGNNDALVASLIGFAVVARTFGHMRLLGVLIGLAVLLKFYPLLLLPFLAIQQKRILWKPILWAAGTTAIGFFLAFSRWGQSTFLPLLDGVERPATNLSIVKYLERAVPESPLVNFLSEYNSVLVVVFVAAIFFAARALNADWIVACGLGMLAMTMVYKVGHQQFLVTWLVLVAAGLVYAGSQGRTVALISLPLALSLSIFQYIYVQQFIAGTLAGPEGDVLPLEFSLPLFTVEVMTIVAIFSYLIVQRHSRGTCIAQPSTPVKSPDSAPYSRELR